MDMRTPTNAELAGKLDKIAAQVQITAQITCRIGPAQSSRDPQWKKIVQNFYRCQTCIILRSLSSKWPDWTLPPNLPKDVVGEHIFPLDPRYHSLAKAAEIQLDNPRNGLPLLKHIEEEYGNGNLMLLPLGETLSGMEVQIFVSQEIAHNKILTGFPGGGCRRPVSLRHRRTWEWHELTFGDLHQHVVHLSQRPFLRSLLQKALLAHSLHEELPNPQLPERMRVFATGCDKMRIFQQVFEIAGTEDCSSP